VNEERTLEVEIEPGVRDGMEYPFIGEGTYVGTALLLSFDSLLFRDTRLVCMAVEVSQRPFGIGAGVKCCVLCLLLKSGGVVFVWIMLRVLLSLLVLEAHTQKS